MKTNMAQQQDGVTISCYLNEVPGFIGTALEQLYETLHSSLPFFTIFRSVEQVNCYVARRGDAPACILLFAVRGRSAEVLNEMIDVAAEEVERFARYVFDAFAQVDVIRFPAVRTCARGVAFPFQRYGSKDTYYIELPHSAAEYAASIGKSTRASINNKANSVRRQFPGFSSRFLSSAEIDDAQLHEIMRLSEAKINAGGARVTHDTARITAMAKQCGFVHLLLIDGKICAGSINYRIGANYFGEVIAYDRRYEKFSIGKLCAYQTICESIARGGRRFYMGGGVFDFKQSLRGMVLGMDELKIYRSPWKLLANPRHALAAACGGRARALKKALQRRRERLPVRLALACIDHMQGFLASARPRKEGVKKRPGQVGESKTVP